MIRWGLKLALIIALILGGREAVMFVTSWLDMSLLPESPEMMRKIIIVAMILYVLLLMIPFVPGAEIGLTLLTLLGGAIAPLVYAATALSLTLVYFLGWGLGPDVLARLLRRLGLARAAAFVTASARLSYTDLQAELIPDTAPAALRGLVRYRYLAIALALNMPGNIVLGGGGGIAMMAGLTRFFAPLPFVATVVVAVLPVPLLFYLGRYPGL